MKRLLFVCLLVTLATPLAAETSDFNAAQELTQQGEIDAAVAKYKDILLLDPENTEARYELGQLYLKNGNIRLAEKEFSRAHLLGISIEKIAEPLLGVYLAQGKFADINAFIEKYQNPENSQSLQSLFKSFEGFSALSAKQYPKALMAFNEAIELDLSNHRPVLGLASVYVAKQETEKAIETLSAYLSKNVDHPQVLLLRANLQRKLGSIEKAYEDYQLVVKESPGNFNAHLGLVLTSLIHGQPQRALLHVKQFPEKFQQTPLLKYLWGITYYSLNQRDKAKSYLAEVLQTKPDHMQSQLALGAIYYAEKNWQLAQEYLRGVQKQLPDNLQITKMLAATYLQLNEPEKTIELLQQRASAHSDLQTASLLGAAYLRLGENDKANEWFVKALELSPEHTGIKTQLALGFLAGGDAQGAISTLESAIDLGEDLVQADVLLVMSYLKTGQIKKALDLTQTLKSKYKDSPIPFNLEGLSFMAQKDYQQADLAFQSALSVDPDFYSAILNRARNKLAMNDYAAAEKHFKELLERDGKNRVALQNLADLSRRKNDITSRRGYLQAIIAEYPQDVAAVVQLAEIELVNNKSEVALKMLASLPDRFQSDPVVLRLKGMTLIQLKEIAEAVKVFEQLVKTVPANMEANFQLGRALLLNNEADKASSYLRIAAEVDEKLQHPVIWIALAESLLRENRFDEALTVIEKLKAAGHESIALYDIEVALYLATQQATKLLEVTEVLFKNQPDTRRVNNLASLYQKQGQTDKSIQLLEKWLEKHSDDLVSQSVLALMHQQNGDIKRAVELYENIVRVQGDKASAIVLNNLAWLYHKQKDDRAIQYAERAYLMAQDKPEIIDTYGWILFEQGQVQKALPVLQQAMLQKPGHAEIAYHVAVALKKLDRVAEAEPILKKIISQSSDVEYVKKAKILLDN